jgi:hypothetical protein
MKRPHALASAALLLAACAAVHALPIVRCGNTYTDAPCPGGQPVEVSDTRTPEQAKEQQTITERTRRAADKLEAQRHVREAEEQVARAKAQQEMRHQIEFEARMRRLEQPPVVAVRQMRVAGLAPGSSTLPPLQRVPMYKVPRPAKPLPQGKPDDDKR